MGLNTDPFLNTWIMKDSSLVSTRNVFQRVKTPSKLVLTNHQGNPLRNLQPKIKAHTKSNIDHYSGKVSIMDGGQLQDWHQNNVHLPRWKRHGRGAAPSPWQPPQDFDAGTAATLSVAVVTETFPELSTFITVCVGVSLIPSCLQILN